MRDTGRTTGGAEWVLPERFETDDGVVRWSRLGDGGAPMVPVHGTPYWSYLWRDIAPALARSRTVYVFDHLGYGQSDKHEGQDLTLAAQTRRFTRLLAHWGLEEPSVVAGDIGGAIVLRAHLLESVPYRDLTIFDAVSGGHWERGLFQLMREHPEVFAALPGCAHEAPVAAHPRGAGTRAGQPTTGSTASSPKPTPARTSCWLLAMPCAAETRAVCLPSPPPRIAAPTPGRMGGGVAGRPQKVGHVQRYSASV